MTCTEQYAYINGSGDTFNLTQQDEYLCPQGIDGRFMAPPNFITQTVPERDGTTFRSVQLQTRALTIPITIMGAARAEVRTRLVALMQALNPKLGLGTFRLTTEAGTQRDLYCIYESGLENADNDLSDRTQGFVLSLRAFDPYWYDTTPSAQSWTTGQEPGTLFPIFPIVLASSTVFSQPTIDNAGDAEAWPVWTITGPGSAITLRNNTTGEFITLSTVVGAGQTLEIDTRPGYKTITLDGVNVFDDMSATSSLWALAVGSNSISLEINGATGATIVNLSYQRRWLST